MCARINYTAEMGGAGSGVHYLEHILMRHNERGYASMQDCDAS